MLVQQFSNNPLESHGGISTVDILMTC